MITTASAALPRELSVDGTFSCTCHHSHDNKQLSECQWLNTFLSIKIASPTSNYPATWKSRPLPGLRLATRTTACPQHLPQFEITIRVPSSNTRISFLQLSHSPQFYITKNFWPNYPNCGLGFHGRSALICEWLPFGFRGRGQLIILLPHVSPASVAGIFIALLCTMM